MAKIFISYAHEDVDFVRHLSAELQRFNHEVFYADRIAPGAEWQPQLERVFADADAVILILSSQSATRQWLLHEAGVAMGYARERGRPLIIPVLIERAPVPAPLQNLQYIDAVKMPPADVAGRVAHALDAHLGRLRAKEEQKREVIKRVEQTAADYIKKSIDQLRSRESRYQKLAYFCYALAYIPLLIGVGFGIWRASQMGRQQFTPVQVAELFAAGLIVIGLLVALSKFSFVLGKSFMIEALRNADRYHAISFGEFYLNAFGDNAQWSEVKEALQHWNFDKSGSFVSLDAKDYDPKTFELAVDLVRAASSLKGKSGKS